MASDKPRWTGPPEWRWRGQCKVQWPVLAMQCAVSMGFERNGNWGQIKITTMRNG